MNAPKQSFSKSANQAWGLILYKRQQGERTHGLLTQ